MMNASEQLLCLSLLSKCKTLKSVQQVHAHVSKTGLDTDLLVAGKLLLHCAVTISDALDYARRLFFHFPGPDVFMYNALIRGFAESETPQNSIIAFKDMLRESVEVPDSFSFAFVLKGTANLRCLRTGLQLHCQSLCHGLNKHAFVGTTLVSMYGECGRSGFARQVFEEMFQPNVVTWNAMITACFRCGDWKGAMAIFSAMPIQNLTSWNLMLAGYTKAGEFELARQAFSLMPSKDEVSWSTMIVGFTQYGFFHEALEFFRELQRNGMRPNEVSLTSVLSACAQAGALDLGRLLHSFLEKAGFFQIVSVNNALIDTYSRCGNVNMARFVFQSMPVGRNIVSYTVMIAAFAMQGYGHEAVQCFREMEASGIRPDGITLISILYACSHAGLIQQGSSYFSKMKNEFGIEPAVEHYGCMVDLYGRAGRLKEAYDFVCHMPIAPNAIIWRTLLGACSFHGNIELAKQVKEKLSELDPNHSGDHVLLSNVYAVAGKWKDVASVRRSMMEQRITKTPGWSMIEVDKVMYRFVAGAKQNKTAEEAYYKLKEIILKLRVEVGYVPEFKSVLHDIEEEEKEDSVSKHSEKLAVAFGLAKLPKGKVIRIVKNLRICTDCHTVMKLISKVYDVEIIARDRSRFHSFLHGSCSCNDYW